jgi:hypothetical protein
MVKKNALSTLIIYPLIHIRQKKKIALEIAVKVASVNWRLGSGLWGHENLTNVSVSISVKRVGYYCK